MTSQEQSAPAVIINACFPRSGHRFLRQLVARALGEDFKFCDYHPVGAGENIDREKLSQANYIKAHDFDLVGPTLLSSEFGSRRKFLVQIRHPLYSIASYYEFALKHGHLAKDDEKTWLSFLESRLAYWKQFVETWALGKQDNPNFLLVSYEELTNNTQPELKKVLSFIKLNNRLSDDELINVISDIPFHQYNNEESSEKRELRKLASFPYYDNKLFSKIDKDMRAKYLEPLAITQVP